MPGGAATGERSNFCDKLGQRSVDIMSEEQNPLAPRVRFLSSVSFSSHRKPGRRNRCPIRARDQAHRAGRDQDARGERRNLVQNVS